MKDILYQISGVLILLSAVLYMLLPVIAAWIMAGSIIVFSIITVMNPYPGKSIRGKRLFNFQIFACVFMIAATYLMFVQRMEWVLAMVAGAILTLYSSVVIPKELEKEEKDQQN